MFVLKQKSIPWQGRSGRYDVQENKGREGGEGMEGGKEAKLYFTTSNNHSLILKQGRSYQRTIKGRQERETRDNRTRPVSQHAIIQ